MRTFPVGSIVYAYSYKDRNGVVFNGPYTVEEGRYDKRGSQYILHERGKYIKYRTAPDRYEDCYSCNGTGVIEGAPGETPECTRCHGSGKVLYSHNTHFVIDRVDRVISEAEYAPVLEAKALRAAQREQGEIARIARLDTHIDNIINIVIGQGPIDYQATKEAVAEYIYRWSNSYDNRSSELYTAAYRVLAAKRDRVEQVN